MPRHLPRTRPTALPSSAGSKGAISDPLSQWVTGLLLPWPELKPAFLWGEGPECGEPAELTCFSPFTPKV